MRFLLDANLSPALIGPCVRQVITRSMLSTWGLLTADDAVILDRAADESYVVITTDSDFPTMLALHGADSPSVAHLRHINELSWQAQAALLVANCGRSRNSPGAVIR